MDENAVTEAAQFAMEDFKREYDGQVCAVCQQEKWPQSPFCRACSIKLQRAHLMKAMQAQMDYYGREWKTWPEFVLNHFWRHYDTCRLYLIDVKRFHDSFNSKESDTHGKN